MKCLLPVFLKGSTPSCVQWLRLNEIVNLHTAVAHKEMQRDLEQALAHQSTEFGCNAVVKVDSLHWLANKQFYLTKIALGSEMGDLETQRFESYICKAHHLSFAHNNRITAKSLVPLLQRCSSLQTLDLTECYEVSEDALIIAIATGGSKLTTLNLHGCTIVTDRALDCIAHSCPELRELCCAYNFSITDAGVKVLAQRCTRLEALDLTVCSNISNEGVDALAEHCSTLRHLDLTNCSRVTDCAVRNLAAKCAALRSLILCFCSKITNSTLQAIAHTQPQMRVLNFNGCRKLTDRGVVELVEHCCELTLLDLPYCTKITDQSVRAVAEHCTNIQHLNVSNCLYITNEAVMLLAQRCPQLCSLKLSYCSELTDEAVQELAERCVHLQWLDISGCGQITDASLMALRERSRELAHLNVAFIYHLDWQQLQQVSARCTRLTSLVHSNVMTHLGPKTSPATAEDIMNAVADGVAT